MRTFLSRFGRPLALGSVMFLLGLGATQAYSTYTTWTQIRQVLPQVIQALSAHEQALRQLTGKPTVGIADGSAPPPTAAPPSSPAPPSQ